MFQQNIKSSRSKSSYFLIVFGHFNLSEMDIFFPKIIGVSCSEDEDWKTKDCDNVIYIYFFLQTN